MSPAVTLRPALPYQGQLLSELVNHPFVCSSQGDEVEHDEAARYGRQVTSESMLFRATWKQPNTFYLNGFSFVREKRKAGARHVVHTCNSSYQGSRDGRTAI
jgi:hypothetical protein